MNFKSTYSSMTPLSVRLPKIVVLGLGGGGSNAINRMIESGMKDVMFIAANTDAQALAKSLAPNKIQLGPKATRGLGAGGLPVVGQTAAEESTRDLVTMLQGAEMVFLTAGMGGGTGTGSISVAAKIAKAVGAVVIAIVTKPFSFELGRRQQNAEEGLAALREHTDTLIVIPNDKLIEIAPKDLPLDMAFTLADDVLRQSVQGISELITETGLINVDFSHIKNVMSRGGGALMAIGTGSGPNKVQQAIDRALHHPLLDDIDLMSATGMIANFTGSSNLSFKEVTDALQALQQATGYHADIIPGIITDSRMDDRVQLILIVTGIGMSGKDVTISTAESYKYIPQHQTPSQPVVHADPPRHNQVEQKEVTVNHFNTFGGASSNLDIPTFLRRRANSGK
ncbi:MAG: cell division protein FtsZ [Anaerolineaceae bacterium]|jgi:cell division protein FtsZ